VQREHSQEWSQQGNANKTGSATLIRNEQRAWKAKGTETVTSIGSYNSTKDDNGLLMPYEGALCRFNRKNVDMAMYCVYQAS
jgi:hypothetical protein